MEKDKLKALVASELIIVAMEMKGKRPTKLNFEEMIDVVTEVINKTSGSKSSGNCEYFYSNQCDCTEGSRFYDNKD